MHKNTHGDGYWYWQFVRNYTKKGHTTKKKIVVNADPWNQALDRRKCDVVRNLADNTFLEQEEKEKLWKRVEVDDTDDFWIITCYPGMYSHLFAGSESGIKNMMMIIANSVITEIKEGHRNWYTQRVVK